MVWGQSPARGVSDLVQRLKSDDPALTSLHILRFRQLDDKGMQDLGEALRSNTTLVELSCSCHPISVGAAAAVGQALAANTSLQTLSIGNSTFGDEAQQALCAGLEHNTSLTGLDCEHKGLTSASGTAVGQLLQHHPRLCCLSLSRNPLGDAGVAALSSGWRCLTRLQLASCDITPKGVAELAACPSTSTLVHLDLSHNSLPGAEGGAAVARLLGAAAGLRQLHLSHTDLGNEGLQALADNLEPHQQLQQLDLSSSGCGLQGAAAVAGALAVLPGLTAMDLSHNPDVTDDAAQQLAVGWAAACSAAAGPSSSSPGAEGQLPSQQQQQQQQQPRGLALDVSGCQLKDGALQALLGMPGLVSLNVMGSHLTVAGARAVASALSSNHALRLKDLNMCACQLSMEALEVLLPAAAAFAGSTGTGVVGPALVEVAQNMEQQGKHGACSDTRLVLAVGGNPAVQEDGFEALLERVLTSSTGLVVHWRAAGGDQDAHA